MDILSDLAKRKQSAPIKFNKRQRERIKEKYGNRCALCCRSVEDNVEICVVHKTALVDGGKATIANGLVLCRECSDTRYDTDANSSKNYVSLMLKIAQYRKDKRTEDFLSAVLKVYDEYNINSQIKWKEDE